MKILLLGANGLIGSHVYVLSKDKSIDSNIVRSKIEQGNL